MGNYIKLFNDKIQQDAFVSNVDYRLPNVSCTKDGNDLKYESLKNGQPPEPFLGKNGIYIGRCWVGAHTSGEPGKRYAGGETSPKQEYTGENYKYGTANNLTKYDSDGKTQLEAIDDPATVNGGPHGRTLSFNEIRSSLGTYFPITEDGQYYKLTNSDTGEYIMLPIGIIATSDLYSTDHSKFIGLALNGTRTAIDRCGNHDKPYYFLPVYTP